MSEEQPILERLGVDTGYRVSHTKEITEKDVRMFAEVSGDFNPVHLDEAFAQKTMFQGRIAHGVLAISLISAAMAKLPGLVILLSHQSRFLKPVRIGDTITAAGEATSVRKDKGIVVMRNTCTNQDGETVVEGETTVRLFPPPG
ncbi:MAG: MaoC family dehydratase [Chloroflexota bacterium]